MTKGKHTPLFAEKKPKAAKNFYKCRSFQKKKRDKIPLLFFAKNYGVMNVFFE